MTTVIVPTRWQRERKLSSQYGAAALVFDFVPRCWAFCDDHGVRKGDLLEAARAWSHGEQILIKVALDLFDPGCVRQNGHVPADAGEIANVLGDRFFSVFCQAMRMARGEVMLSADGAL
jgi:hypothetical protein